MSHHVKDLGKKSEWPTTWGTIEVICELDGEINHMTTQGLQDSMRKS